jgi:hypothetical protein
MGKSKLIIGPVAGQVVPGLTVGEWKQTQAPEMDMIMIRFRLAILRFFNSTVRVAHDSIKPGA